MRKHFIYLFCAGLLLSSCLEEQNNPLLIVGSCVDGIQNQNEEGVDCGGICKACQVIEPVVVPCHGSLSDNRLTIDGINTTLTASDYHVSKESDHYKIFIWKDYREITIRIRTTSLPQITTAYPLQHWASGDSGYASIRLISFYSCDAISGTLFLSYVNDTWVVEVCPVNLIGQGHTFEFSSRIICNW